MRNPILRPLGRQKNGKEKESNKEEGSKEAPIIFYEVPTLVGNPLERKALRPQGPGFFCSKTQKNARIRECFRSAASSEIPRKSS
jgi:hypothetical protein